MTLRVSQALIADCVKRRLSTRMAATILNCSLASAQRWMHCAAEANGRARTRAPSVKRANIIAAIDAGARTTADIALAVGVHQTAVSVMLGVMARSGAVRRGDAIKNGPGRPMLTWFLGDRQ